MKAALVGQGSLVGAVGLDLALGYTCPSPASLTCVGVIWAPAAVTSWARAHLGLCPDVAIHPAPDFGYTEIKPEAWVMPG